MPPREFESLFECDARAARANDVLDQGGNDFLYVRAKLDTLLAVQPAIMPCHPSDDYFLYTIQPYTAVCNNHKLLPPHGFRGS